jgi:hypothetical protein
MNSETAVPAAAGRMVQGRVHGPGRRGLVGLFVEVVDCVVGGDTQVGESETDEDGAFAVLLPAADLRPVPDLQVRVWTSAGPEATLVGESRVAYDVTDALVALDVPLEPGAVGLESEYDALFRAAAPFVGGRLGDLEESGARSDMTHVANKSRWDARGIAYAALADRLAGDTGDAVPAPLFYALLRAGLPSEPGVLFRTSIGAVQAVWTDAMDDGIIARDLAERLPESLRAFEAQAAIRLLRSRVSGLSSMDELLELTFPGDGDMKTTVAGLQVRADSPDAFWESVESSLDADAARRLRLDSQLAAMTLNNAPLVASLRASQADHPAGALRGAEDLARRGFHRADRWVELLDDSVPDLVPGDDTRQRRQNYADYLAAQVRLSYPTAVLAAKVADGELAVADDHEVRDGVATFLSDHVGRFELGVEPVGRFIAANDGVEAPEDPRVVEGIQRLQRLYQVTPDDDSLAVLLDQGLHSATAIADVPAAEFVRTRAEDLGEPIARLIHARAEQISDFVTQLVTSYVVARTSPRLGVVDPGVLVSDESGSASGVLSIPTLEGLFGSMNTEACEHCGSVLSPAAYLVDLLLFLDRPRTVAVVNPLEELLKRRPDIGHLPLTCDNTNTLVPHIDLVTETLEHFVTHNLSLSGFAGHTTPDGQTSEESLARPAFVDDDAYHVLKQARYPAPLPFHRHLEDLRAMLERLGVPLSEALRILRRSEETAPETGYGWHDIAREQAGISRPLATVLTDRSVGLPELLGYPESTPVATVLADLSTVRGWASRLDLTYEEVDRLLGSRFVNPDLLMAAPPQPPETGPRILPLFDQFVVRHVDPDRADEPVTTVEALRLARFVRLWRALGWSIETTDAALVALLSDQATDGVVGAVSEADLDGALVTVLGRLGTLLDVVRRLDLDVAEDLPSLLACWADLETTGPAALYGRLFLLGGAQHAAFAANEDGEVLTDPPKLNEQFDALRAAFGVSAEELAEAADDLEEDEDLTLPTVSKLFRRTWLARKLGLGQRDFGRLLAVSGIDPFKPPDQPGADIVRLLDLLDGLAATGVTSADAVSCLWPQDITAAERIDPLAMRLARDVRLRRRAADAVLQVGEGMSANRVAELLTLRFGPAGRHFAALVDHALDVEVPYQQDVATLAGDVIAAGDGRITYFPTRRRLSFSGPMTTSTRDALKAANDSPTVFDRAVDALFAASEERARTDGAFAQLGADLGRSLREYPEFAQAWSSHLVNGTGQANLLDTLLADVRATRHRSDVVAAVTALTGSTDALAAAFLDARDLLGDRVAATVVGDVGRPGLEVATEGGRATHSGFVDVTEAGAYRFGVRTAAGNVVELRVDDQEVDLEADGELLRSSSTLNLPADRLVAVELVVAPGPGEEGARPTLEWQRGTESWTPILADAMYGEARVKALRRVFARFVAAQQVTEVFALQPAGLLHLARLSSLQFGDQSWVATLAVLDSSERLEAGAVLDACVGFARLVKDLGISAETLVALLEDPAATRGDRRALADAAGWEESALQRLLDHWELEPEDLGDIGELSRVAEAMRLSSSTATPLGVLLTAATPDPDADAVRLVEAALRSRHGGGWLDVLKAVSDSMRIQRRDALVAYVLRELRQMHPEIDTAEKLFEFFLMDVQMQPPIATSRVRHAISAVQLFVERILMNLDAVPPEVFENLERWESLKRYRLWEANRQLYLWPENWLEPQLRTDQSPAFRRTMSELLQSDITEDSAATALLGYLSQLEEVAKLEPVATHEDEGDPRYGDEVSHVVARTPGAQRRYYYRMRNPEGWTAWEPIGLDIEDNPVMPVLWKGRLLLFWLKIVNTNPPAPPVNPEVAGKPLVEVSLGELQDPSARNPQVRPKAVLCWSEYYNQRWQPPKTSDVGAPASLLKDFAITGDSVFDRGKLRLGATLERGILRIRIWGTDFGTSFLFYNTHSLPQRQEDSPNPDAVMDIELFGELVRDIETSDNTLRLVYRGLAAQTTITRELIARNDGTPYRITAPFHVGYTVGEDQQGLIHDPWLTPFIYSDGQHAFFVNTSSPVLDHEGAGVGVVPTEPKLRGLPGKRFWPLIDELGSARILDPMAGGLGGAAANVVLGDVEISPLGRTSRVVPTSKEERHG